MPSNRNQLNVRLSPHGWAAFHLLQDHYGQTQAALIEMLLRAQASREGLKPR